MASTLRSVDDMPTISALYRSKKLKPSTKQASSLPNQANNDKVCLIQGDITLLQIDAIVNAANSKLSGGAGVNGAIQAAAGPELLKECLALKGCETGSAKITDAYQLPCRKVIHAVGPMFSDYNKEVAKAEPFLRGAYRTSLSLAAENNCRTIAFPAISRGIYKYPRQEAAWAALWEAYDFLNLPEGSKLDKIIFCNFQNEDAETYAELIPLVFPPTEQDLA